MIGRAGGAGEAGEMGKIEGMGERPKPPVVDSRLIGYEDQRRRR